MKIIMLCISTVIGGCREQERNECEAICRKNANNETYCELRAALILPNSSKIEASMPRVRLCILTIKFTIYVWFLSSCHSYLTEIWNYCFIAKCTQRLLVNSLITSKTQYYFIDRLFFKITWVKTSHWSLNIIVKIYQLKINW